MKAINADRPSLARWAFGVFLLAAFVVVVLRLGDIQEFVQLVRSAKPEWLLLALVAQVATYVAAGAIWQEVLKESGQSLASLATLAIWSFSQIRQFPSAE